MILSPLLQEPNGVVVSTEAWRARGPGIESHYDQFYSYFARFLRYLYISFRVPPFPGYFSHTLGAYKEPQ